MIEPIPKGEFSLIRWIRSQIPEELRKAEKSIGDDASVIRTDGGSVAISTDMIVEGVDFRLDSASPRRIGWKALGVTLSDIAAMGLKPEYALTAVNLPEDQPISFAQELFLGMLDIAKQFGVEIVGGDTSSSPGGLCVVTTALALVKDARPIYRSGGRVGDSILVTGELGGSILGKHLDFVPRIDEGMLLNRNFPIHAMIDISDGLSSDLSHLAEASGLGAVVEEKAIPVSNSARELSSKTGRTPIECALNDGEDFELLFTLSPEDAKRLLSAPPFATKLTPVGRLIPRGFFLEDSAGNLITLERRGYEHFKGR